MINARDLSFAAPELVGELTRWLEHLSAERRMSGKTCEAYARDVLQFLRFMSEHFGARVTLGRLAKLSPADVRAFMAARRADGASRPLMRTLPGVRCLRASERNGKVGALAAVRVVVASRLPPRWAMPNA